MPYADPERAREQRRRHYAANRDAIKAQTAAWRAANLDRHRALVRRFKENNPHYHRDRYQSDENYRVRVILSKGIHHALIHRRTGKDWQATAKLGAIVGCSKPDLIKHIESQFLPGMCWSNYGRNGWEIDHIKPCARFDLTKHKLVVVCFHYSNLRPLWRSDNRRKHQKE
jgi:hypothetical protein